MQNDWNDLDRALYALVKSISELPEVFRRLMEGELRVPVIWV